MAEAPTEATVLEKSEQEGELSEHISEVYGPYWIVLAVEGFSEEGFDLAANIGPGLTLDAAYNVLRQGTKAFSDFQEAATADSDFQEAATSDD